MIKTEKIWREFISLAPELQQQVADFIVFLRTRQTSIRLRRVVRRTMLANEPFIAMWSNREDMRDSSAWVRAIRQANA